MPRNGIYLTIDKKLQIRSSTAEFLIFQLESKEDGIEVLYQDETLWLTQDAIAVLFDKGRSTIDEHLQNIFQSQELLEDSVVGNSDELLLMAKIMLQNIII